MTQSDLFASKRVEFGVHISAAAAASIAATLVAQDRRLNGMPAMTPAELDALKVEHVRLVATFA